MNPLSNQGSSALALRLARVQARIAAAAVRSGRPAEAVTLLAVVKFVPDPIVAELLALGVREVAENRVQNLLARPPELLAAARFHLIGSLQTNKARRAVATAAEFHALDRPELLAVLREEAARAGRRWPVWVQVNVAREPQKHGCTTEALPALAAAAAAAPELELRGLMTMAPDAEDPEAARPHFAALAELSRSLRQQGKLPPTASGLSMGMSGDFEVAVEEGATVVRIGSALFQPE